MTTLYNNDKYVYVEYMYIYTGGQENIHEAGQFLDLYVEYMHIHTGGQENIHEAGQFLDLYAPSYK